MDRSERPEEEALADGAFESSAAAAALRQLGSVSPPQTLTRFRKRAVVLQGTRMLFESQVFGFWVVLDAFMRLIFGSKPLTRVTPSRREER